MSGIDAFKREPSRVRVILQLFAGLSAAAVLLAVLRWMASEVFEGEADAFDQAVRSGMLSIASPTLTAFFIGISILGSAAFLTAAGAVILGRMIYSGRKREALVAAAAMAGAIVLNLGLKAIYARPRPEPFFDLPLPASFSFPSGHTLGGLCCYGITAWIIATRTQSRTMRWAVPIAAAILILLIGVSRVYLGVHYPTDVLAGFAAGTVWLTTVCLVDRYLFTKESRWARAK